MSDSSGTSSARCNGRSVTSRGCSAASGFLGALSALFASIFAVATPACGGAGRAPASVAVERPTASAASAVAARRSSDAARAPASSHHVATIAKNALGPFVARAGGVGLAAWIATAESGPERELVVVPIAADGVPLAEPRVVGKVHREATSLVVRPSGGARGGWILAWTAVLDRGESLTVLGLGQDGRPRAAPNDVARTSDHIKWCDMIPTPAGAVGVWAEETPTGDANLLTTAIDGSGGPVGMPVRVAHGIDRWQAVAVDGGVGLALVTSDPREGRPAAGRLTWLTLDAQGHPTAQGRAVGTRPTVSGPIEAAPLANGVVLAWTDRTGADAQVMLASVDPSGRVQGPVPALDAAGGAALVALAAGPQAAALAWEEPSTHSHPRRPLHLALISTGSRLSAQSVTAIEMVSDSAPEFVGIDGGFALLARAHACISASAGACEGPVIPTFVRFDARLNPLQTEPIVLAEPNAAASLAWNLRCIGDRCVALAATTESPTPVFVVDLVPRVSPFATPTAAAIPVDAPRITSLQTIATGPAYDDLAAVRLGDSTVVAALNSADGTHGTDKASRRRAPRAALTVRVLDDNGQPRRATQMLTSRAIPSGGITLALGGAVQDGAAVAWVTGGADLDRQVHVARLDRTGRRDREIELTTRAKGDVSSVAMTWAGDGWLVAWVDERDGNGEVYATKVDRELVRTAREERITNAPGDAGDVALAAHGDVAWLAWSDPRESPAEGLSDIYATTLRTTDAKRASDEIRVLASAPHSRSPQLAPTTKGDSVVIAWIEDAATGLEGPGAAMVAMLGRDGRVIEGPSILALSGKGYPTSIALSASPEGVRTAVVRSGPDAVALEVVILGRDGRPETQSWPLFGLEASPSFEVALAFAGSALVFDDAGSTAGEHVVRRAEVFWPR